MVKRKDIKFTNANVLAVSVVYLVGHTAANIWKDDLHTA